MAVRAGTSGDNDVSRRLEAMERRLERLSDIASDIAVAALNGDIKLRRREREEVEAIHDRLALHAEHVDREVDRLVEQFDELAARVEAPARRGLVDGRAPATTVQQAGTDLPGGDRSPARADGDVRRGRDRNPGIEFGSETDGQSPAPRAARTVDELLPDRSLRCMWRIPGQPPGNDEDTTGRTDERWFVETRSNGARSSDGVDDRRPEFPPEVTEFALDDDEIPFDVLFEMVADDDRN